jgi:hypothetical protein
MIGVLNNTLVDGICHRVAGTKEYKKSHQTQQIINAVQEVCAGFLLWWLACPPPG